MQIMAKSTAGLIEKLVPVAGSVSKDGTVTKPHVAHRKVRPAGPVAHLPSKKERDHAAAAIGDLFDNTPAAPPETESAVEMHAKKAAAQKPEKAVSKPAEPAEPKKPFKEVVAESKARSEGLTAAVKAEFEKNGRVKAARNNEPSQVLGLTRGTESAPYRVTSFDENGPVGHRDYASIEDAAGEFYNTWLDPKPRFKPAPAPEPEAKEAAGTEAAPPAKDPSTFGVPAGISKDARRAINAECVALLNDLPIPADKLPILRQYSGNGGCGDSLNEFYTEPKVAAAIWTVLAGLGIGPGASVLEPSCATGVFMETAPDGVAMVGVEMDPTSAQIGGILHPGAEVQNASLERFAQEDTRLFDAVIGNAPFGLRGSLIKDDKPKLKTAEAYFCDTSMDKLRAGGVMAMIVPTGVMDSKRDRKLRENLLRKGEFLGAVRMPNTAFEHSHTEVTTDVVFFKKRDLDVAAALQAVDQAGLKRLGVWDEEFLAGDYFTERGAANVFGTMTEGWRAKAGMGDDITVEGSMLGVPDAIAAFVPELTAPVPLTVSGILAAAPDEESRTAIRSAALKRPYEAGKRGDVKYIDGVQYVLEGQPLRWHRVDEFMQTAAVTEAQVLAQEIDAAIKGAELSLSLADRIKAYIAAHGQPAKNHDVLLAAATDKVLYRLIGAVRPDGSLSDLVEHRAAEPIESSFDAAAQSLALESGWFKPEQVAARWHGGDTETVLDHLYASPDYAIDPKSGLWTSIDQYISGEMWPKLDEARESLAAGGDKPEVRGKLERQVKALEEAIGSKSLEDVEIMLNSAFLPLAVVEAFFNEKKAAMGTDGNDWVNSQPPYSITFDKGIYHVKGGLYDAALLGKYLNRAGVRKEEDLPTINKWNEEFKAWLCASKYRDEIEELYNRKFLGFRQKAYSDKPFEIPGLNVERIKPHVYSGLRCALETRKGIVADDVGLGKTVQGLILARMAKIAGNAKKPIIVVPKSVLVNWVAEAESFFPGCSVLTIGETITKDKNGKFVGRADTAAERNRKYHDLTQNDYDFVLISQPAWNDLDLDPQTKGEYVESDFWVQRGDALGNAGDKRMNKIRESYKQSIAGREFQRRTDVIYFNDLGVDMLIGDEFHAFKNLYAAKNRFGMTPKFLGGSGLSNRALDTNLKARLVREQNGGNNVYGLTATPTKNSPLEIYSMLSHIAPEAFENIGIRNSEEFLDRFCEFKTENVLNTRGEIEEALVTVGFKNLDELREIMKRFINRRTAEDVGLILPKRDDRQHLIDMSAEQKAVYEQLRILAKSAKGKDAKGDAHIFSIMDKMGKAAMDLELLDPGAYAGAKSPKYAAAVEQIIAGAKDGGQVVFADSIGSHEKLAAALAASGIPRNRIAIMNAQSAPTATSRQNISDAFNAGKLDVVIGNTATMGEGQNLQKRTTDLHNLDLPWDPSSMQQRVGRGLRQGNINESMRIHTYISKGSFDGYRYQSMMAKKSWMDLLWNGGDRVENLAREGNLSHDDLMVMLAADPEAARVVLDRNKGMAEAKFKAEKHAEAAADFVRFRDMKRSFSSLKSKNTRAGERLRVTIERLRHGLEQNEYFKPKHALDAKTPVLIQPTTGDAIEAGGAFELPAEESIIHGGGKFVVTGVRPSANAEDKVMVRRYGSPSAAPLEMSLKDLDRSKVFQYDSNAEQAEVAAALAESAKAKLGSLKGLKDLHGMPSAIVQANYDSIQRQAKSGIKEYKFDVGYGAVGTVNKKGEAIAHESYEARGALDDHDLMLPTDEHRQKAMDAYLADERAKRWETTYETKRRGGRSEPREVLRYPGRYGQSSNRWGEIGNHVFGEGFKTDAHAAYQRGQYERARHAKTLPEAIAEIVPATRGDYGSSAWSKRAIATLWAKAKQTGKLGADLESELPKARGITVASLEKQSGGGRNYHYYGKQAVGQALIKLAKDHGFFDLAAAMAVGGAESPVKAVGDLLSLPAGQHRTDSLRHLIAKNPHLAELPANDFVDKYDQAASGAVRGLTLAQIADGDADVADAA